MAVIRDDHCIPTAVVNVTTPTLAELTAAFGAPATKQDGWMILNDDAGTSTVCHLIVKDGTKYWFVALTAAA